MKLQNIFIAISSIALVVGCQSVPQHAQLPATQEPLTAQAVPEKLPPPFIRHELPAPQAGVPATDLWARIRAGLSWQAIDSEQVDAARKRFLKQSNYLPVVANRANYYLYHIVEEVEKRGLPMEIALLPLVESTLNPFASSSSQAAGLWQIMPRTGTHLGLEQDWWYDGRRDVRDSTRAALDYLEEMHSGLGDDWLLALAAYNSGQGRVSRAQRANERQGMKTDYWSLKLPRETRNYVPKLIALTQIIADPQRYGVKIPTVANAPSFEVVATGGQLELARAAELAGIDAGTLRALNPGQLRWATSPDTPPELLLPVGTGERFETAVATLGPEDRVQWQHYRIERGDSLIRIAKRFDTQVGLLREVNSIKGSRIRAGDTLMIPRGSAWASSLAMASADTKTQQGYHVRSGDSLYRIAGKFKVSINEIIAWNSLEPGAYLQPGQKLTLYVRGG